MNTKPWQCQICKGIGVIVELDAMAKRCQGCLGTGIMIMDEQRISPNESDLLFFYIKGFEL